MSRWTAVAHFGSPFWEGHDFVLCCGPRWWCHLRASWWLAHREYSRVHITPLTPYLGEDGLIYLRNAEAEGRS